MPSSSHYTTVHVEDPLFATNLPKLIVGMSMFQLTNFGLLIDHPKFTHSDPLHTVTRLLRKLSWGISRTLIRSGERGMGALGLHVS